jgi:plastocyanin
MKKRGRLPRLALLAVGVLFLATYSWSCKNPVGSIDLSGWTPADSSATVTIRASGFDPAFVILQPGGSLTFDNRDSSAHQIVSVCSELNTSSIPAGSRVSLRMGSSLATCTYRDQANPSLTGTVELCNEVALFSCR